MEGYGCGAEYRATIFNFARRWEAGLFIEIKIQGDKEINLKRTAQRAVQI